MQNPLQTMEMEIPQIQAIVGRLGGSGNGGGSRDETGMGEEWAKEASS